MTDWNDEMGWLRERPPVWPRREPDPEPERHPPIRAREPYEPGGMSDLFTGSGTIEDMEQEQDEENLRVLVRYTVCRLLGLTCSALLTGRELRIERRVAHEHLALLPAHDWERRLLGRVVDLCRETPAPSIFGPLLLAAESAAKRGHNHGAFDLYRLGYRLAKSRGWWMEAERTTEGVARLAQLDEAPFSARLWRKRGYVLRRRIERQEALAREAERKAAEKT